jgi:CubicO group peptidase (beta-lactamase class C family)
VPHCPSVRIQATWEINLATPTRTVIQSLSHVDGWVGPHGVPGVGAVVWSGGQIVAERYAGEARPGVPVTSETLFPLASVTKPISAATLMALVDDGEISLDEPVGRLLPEFRAGPPAGDDGVDAALERLRPTIGARQLLCHVSGLPEDLGPRESRYREGATIETVIDQMCRLPLQSTPGNELRYSNAGYGVIARLTEHISGQPFWQAAQSRVFEPLGIREIVADPAGPALERVAHLADTSHPGTDIETYNSAYWRGLALPWGGLFGTPRDAVRFAAAFLPSGERFLSEAATSLTTSDQTMGVPGGVESAKVRWDPGRWGLGWEVKGEKRRHWTGDFTSSRTFCHFGHAGTLLWGDPERDVALAVFANRTVTHMWGFILPRWARLSNAVIAAVTEPATS